MGTSHEEKCRKYKQKVETLKLDLQDAKLHLGMQEDKNRQLNILVKELRKEIKEIKEIKELKD